jgi:hypothetical protein
MQPSLSVGWPSWWWQRRAEKISWNPSNAGPRAELVETFHHGRLLQYTLVEHCILIMRDVRVLLPHQCWIKTLTSLPHRSKESASLQPRHPCFFSCFQGWDLWDKNQHERESVDRHWAHLVWLRHQLMPVQNLAVIWGAYFSKTTQQVESGWGNLWLVQPDFQSTAPSTYPHSR